LSAEVGAAFITSPGRIRGAIMGEDFKGDHFKLMENGNQYMKDFIIIFNTPSACGGVAD
jgi:hypothetical protein